MTQDIIEMARQAGFYNHTPMYFDDEMLVAFANLLEEKVTARYMQKEIQKATEEANARANASWTLMCKKMVAIEREACANLCDARAIEYDGFTEEQNASEKLAQAIRARGEQALAQPKQDGECKYCTHGCAACDARRQSNVLP